MRKQMEKYRIPVPFEVFECIDAITVEDILKATTPRGNGRSLKTNKPKDGVMAYIWRWMRFHSGEDTTRPCTDTFDLSNGIEERTGVCLGFSLSDPTRKDLYDRLEKKVFLALKVIPGADPNAGVRRWQRAFGG